MPSYWWDIEGSEVIVESDMPQYPVCGRYSFDEDAEAAIVKAEQRILDLREGRITAKAAAEQKERK